MKRFVWLIFITLLAIPAFAQDEGDGGFNVDDLFNSDPADPAAATGRGATPVDFLADIRLWLARAKAAPLDQKQVKPLNKIYDNEVKAMAKSFEKQFGVSLDSALAAQAPARGRRGATASRTGTPEAVEIRRLSAQLVDKVIAGLRIDQQAALRRYQSEEIRVTRLNQLTENMTLAGAPLSPEQKPEIESLFARESHLRTLIIVEAKGKPHQGKVAALEMQTTQRVAKLLAPAQKTALVAAMSRSKAP